MTPATSNNIKAVLQLRNGAFGTTLRFRKGLNPLNSIEISPTDSYLDLVQKISVQLPGQFYWDQEKEPIRYQRIKEQPQSTLEKISPSTDFYSVFQSIKIKRRYQQEEFSIQIWIFGKWTQTKELDIGSTLDNSCNESMIEMNREKKRRVEKYLSESANSELRSTMLLSNQAIAQPPPYYLGYNPVLNGQVNNPVPNIGSPKGGNPSIVTCNIGNSIAGLGSPNVGVDSGVVFMNDCLSVPEDALQFDQLLYDHPPKHQIPHQNHRPYPNYQQLHCQYQYHQDSQQGIIRHHHSSSNHHMSMSGKMQRQQLHNNYYSNSQLAIDHQNYLNQQYLDPNAPMNDESFGLNDFTLKVLLNGAPVSLEIMPESLQELRDLL